jgi:Zn-dependent M28 family amino/carboxypeptidase
MVHRTSLVAIVASMIAPAAARADLVHELVDRVSHDAIVAHLEELDYPRASTASRDAASAYIQQELASYGYTVTLDPVLTSENVIARREGTVTPERVFVIGAHFDTVAGSPGADDNTAAVAGILEIARVVADARPRVSIELVAFALEELGLVGSRQYAMDAAAAGVDVVGMMVLEMIAYTCDVPGCQPVVPDIPGCLQIDGDKTLDVGTFVAVIGNDASAALITRYRDAAATYVPELEVVTVQVAGVGFCFPDLRRSDHTPFWDEGYRALQISDTGDFRNPHYHLPSDTLDTLDIVFARRVIQAAMATVLVETGALACQTDLDGSGDVDFGDLLVLLTKWGECGSCAADFDGDGNVDFRELLLMLAAWGPCP